MVIVPQKTVTLHIGISRKNLWYAGQAIAVFSMSKFTIYNFTHGIQLEDRHLWKLQRRIKSAVWVQVDAGGARKYLLTGINETHVRLMEQDDVALDQEN